MVSPRFLWHCGDDHFDFQHILLAYPGLIEGKESSIKVPQVVSKSSNTGQCHSSLLRLLCRTRAYLMTLLGQSVKTKEQFFLAFFFLLSSHELSGELASKTQVFPRELVILVVSPHNPSKTGKNSHMTEVTFARKNCHFHA